jgi:hypothetical protein
VRLARVLLSSFVVSALALPLVANSAAAKPKKAKASKVDSAPQPAEDVQLADDSAPASDQPARDKPSGAADTDEAASDAKPAESKAHSEDASAPAAATDSTPRPSPFDLEAGLRAVNRNFSYKDTPADLFPNKGYPVLVPFRLPLGPALFFDGNFYPGALATSGAAAHFGLAFGYELNFATKAIFAQGSPIERTLHTQASQFYLGARARIPFGAHELGLLGAYGQQKFLLTGDENAPLAPDVHYKFVRLSVDSRFRFDNISFGAHIGTRLVSDTGGLRTDWFPNAKAKSIELGMFLGYRLSRAFDLVAAGDLLRYGFDFNPIPPQTDPWSKPVAGGGTDQYITGSLALRYHVPTD